MFKNIKVIHFTNNLVKKLLNLFKIASKGNNSVQKSYTHKKSGKLFVKICKGGNQCIFANDENIIVTTVGFVLFHNGIVMDKIGYAKIVKSNNCFV